MEYTLELTRALKAVHMDPDGLLETASKAGFRLLRPYLSIEASQLAFPLDQVDDLAQKAASHRLKIASAVMNFSDLSQMEDAAAFAQRHGLTSLVTVITYRQLDEAREIGEKLKSIGCQLLAENKGDQQDFEVLASMLSADSRPQNRDLVQLSVNTGDLMDGGMDPEAFLWQYEDVIGSVTFSDSTTHVDGVRHPEMLGDGDLDLSAVYQFARAHETAKAADISLKLESDITATAQEQIEKAGKELQKITDVRTNSSSILCTYDLASGRVTALKRFDHVIEAPNWMKDGSLLYNDGGHLFRYYMDSRKIVPVDTGFCTNCNNDHVPTQDNRYVFVSHMTFDSGFNSLVYRIPLDLEEGQKAEPVQVTKKGPSFLHGVSPDGKEAAYCAFRNYDPVTGKALADIYIHPTEGGQEKGLTDHQGFNDGPEYSMDGKNIWFISTRTGLMQVWKMDRDGSNQTQMTFEDQNNWFGHISPDGKYVVNIAYHKGALDPGEHLSNMNVSLWLMKADGSERHKILDFFGGQGSINVNSWDPGSTKFAFVMYELEHK